MTRHETRHTVARLLRQSQAHTGLARALEGFPVEQAGRHVEGHSHTAWELLEQPRRPAGGAAAALGAWGE